jgi:hypothetical protein
MGGSESRFVVYQRGTEMKVEVHELAGKKMYLVTSNIMEPLLFTREMENNNMGFWKSVPDGREKEAEEIGRLIAKHIQSNQ